MSNPAGVGPPPAAPPPAAPPLAAGSAVTVLARALWPHPGLWLAALGALHRLARPGWWRRFPPLPVPSDELWRFRMTTAYGGPGDALPERDDVVSFLRWCRDMGRWRRV